MFPDLRRKFLGANFSFNMLELEWKLKAIFAFKPGIWEAKWTSRLWGLHWISGRDRVLCEKKGHLHRPHDAGGEPWSLPLSLLPLCGEMLQRNCGEALRKCALPCTALWDHDLYSKSSHTAFSLFAYSLKSMNDCTSSYTATGYFYRVDLQNSDFMNSQIPRM